MRAVKRFLQDDSGPTAVEYAVLLALILMSALITVSTVGRGTGGLWAASSNAIDAAINGGD